MEEDTTTNAPVDDGATTIQGVQVDDQGQAVAQPDAAESAEAVAPATDEATQEAPKEEEPSSDDNSATEWLKKKGVDPNSPEALEKVAEMYRNAEKNMHSNAKKASELEKAIDTGITEEAEATGFDDEARLDLVRIKTKLNVREFFDNNPDAKPLEQAMIKELANKPHLAGDLESLYALAAVKSGDSMKSQGKREALESLAQNQQAAVPRGNAVNGSVMESGSAITPQNVDQMVAKMSVEEYRKRLPEINKALA